MKPTFSSQRDWEQAEILMQPALIRILDHLRQAIETSAWRGTYQEVQDPYPGHQLILEDQGQAVVFSLWELCFQVCFVDYQPQAPAAQPVTVDPNLLTAENEVDWRALDHKAKHLIDNIFADLAAKGA
ncbi:hypothetical protein [Synechocystis sp. LKSZ1]|uniref:hypothetical protein n=1 Tax=Synechocystis sp. LKSZ1 TaxID=3144951 RepID=UPI00336BD11E